LDHAADVDRVAQAAVGMTGADLREIVSLAVLHVAAGEPHHGTEGVTTELLLRLVREQADRHAIGQYL
jgi:hypothetical protein